MRELRIEALTADAFAPFGQVIAFDPARARRVNQDTADRADTDAVLAHDPAAVPVLALYRTAPQHLPLALSLFERHPHSTQSFVSMSVRRFIVVAAPAGPDGGPDAARARGFLGAAGSGVTYRRDLWHTPILSLDEGGDLLMLIAERGTATDCVEYHLPVPLLVRSIDPAVSERLDHGP